VVRACQRNSIDAEIVLGQHAGKRVFLPWIPFCPSDDQMFPFQFKRKQFPIRLNFAMAVNKSQSQTIPNVGVYLPAPMFSHGQLYVAISRATARTNIKILALPPNVVAEEEEARRQEEKDAKRKQRARVNGMIRSKNKKEYYR
jgi:ATP-dependent DNA helicase PIF1